MKLCQWELRSYTNGKLVRCLHEAGHTRIVDGTTTADHHGRHEGVDVWWNEIHSAAFNGGNE